MQNWSESMVILILGIICGKKTHGDNQRTLLSASKETKLFTLQARKRTRFVSIGGSLHCILCSYYYTDSNLSYLKLKSFQPQLGKKFFGFNDKVNSYYCGCA